MAIIKTSGTDETIKDCILCGDELISLGVVKEELCDYCGKKSSVSHQCRNSHYICDRCLTMTADEHIKQLCLKYRGTDPVALAVQIMNSPVVGIHGVEHHFIVPAVMLTVLHNSGKINAEPAWLLDLAEKRATEESPLKCEYDKGNCGAAVGTGIFLDIFLSRMPYADQTKSAVKAVVDDALRIIRESHGPRCCKRDTYLSLETIVRYLNEKHGTNLPLSEAKCTFSLRNDSCGREGCNYYNISNDLV